MAPARTGHLQQSEKSLTIIYKKNYQALQMHVLGVGWDCCIVQINYIRLIYNQMTNKSYLVVHMVSGKFSAIHYTLHLLEKHLDSTYTSSFLSASMLKPLQLIYYTNTLW